MTILSKSKNIAFRQCPKRLWNPADLGCLAHVDSGWVYEQIPFQFSLHTLEESGTLNDTAFLDLSGNLPTFAFTKALVSACGGEGAIFVYSHFEKQIIRDMANRHPEFAEALETLLPRIVDLLPIARAH
jgi:hypothetical protein